MVIEFLAIISMYSCVGLPNAEAKEMNCPNGVSATGRELVPYKTAACHKSRLYQTLRIENTVVTCIDVHGSKNKNLIDIYGYDYESSILFGRQKHQALLLN